MDTIIDSLLSKFILEVCGATGATWGVLEVLTINNDQNRNICRYISLSVGTLFFIRYIYQHYNLIYNKNN